jgi:hypothetical protein
MEEKAQAEASVPTLYQQTSVYEAYWLYDPAPMQAIGRKEGRARRPSVIVVVTPARRGIRQVVEADLGESRDAPLGQEEAA